MSIFTQPATLPMLTIADLRIWVHLGCGEAEKYHPQLISVTITLTFAKAPLAMTSDRLEDTICYAELVQKIQHMCQNQRFNLIEHLTHAIYQVAHNIATDIITTINVSAHKTAPPVPGVHGGVHFSYSGMSEA